MKKSNPYEYADEKIELLRQQINAEFLNESNNLASFDELNTITKVQSSSKKLYDRLRAYHKRICKEVWADAYASAVLQSVALGYRKKKHLKSDALSNVLLLFAGYNAVTQYQYNSESQRKAERCAEAVFSSPSRRVAREAYSDAARAWFRQAKQYVDLSVDTGRERAFVDTGVRQVMWVTEKDNRVCSECQQRQGMIYRVGNIPPKPHRNCRCHVVPVSQGRDTL